jgi:hypothetical protein
MKKLLIMSLLLTGCAARSMEMKQEPDQISSDPTDRFIAYLEKLVSDNIISLEDLERMEKEEILIPIKPKDAYNSHTMFAHFKYLTELNKEVLDKKRIMLWITLTKKYVRARKSIAIPLDTNHSRHNHSVESGFSCTTCSDENNEAPWDNVKSLETRIPSSSEGKMMSSNEVSPKPYLRQNEIHSDILSILHNDQNNQGYLSDVITLHQLVGFVGFMLLLIGLIMSSPNNGSCGC